MKFSDLQVQLLKQKCLLFAKKTKISKEMINILADENSVSLLKLLSNAKTEEEFISDVYEYGKGQNDYLADCLILGSFFNHYQYYSYTSSFKREYLYKDKYLPNERKTVVNNFRSVILPFILENNNYKKEFLIGADNLVDYTNEFDEKKFYQVVDQVLYGEDINDSSQADVIANIFLQVIENYPKDILLNNFDFVRYEMLNGDFLKYGVSCRKDVPSFESRIEEYQKYKDISVDTLTKIRSFSILKEQLGGISLAESKEVLNRLCAIENDVLNHIDELDDIYLEYQKLFREDIVSRLYVPNEDIEIIEDIKDVKAQMLHLFIRNPNVALNSEIERKKQELIEERDISKRDIEKYPFTDLETKKLNEYQKYVEDVLFNSTLTNKSLNRKMLYSDSSGYEDYYADTSNQVSATIYGRENFALLNGKIGIGFNKEGVKPEAIIFSSDRYLTTNRGINDCLMRDDFLKTSSNFSSVCNGKSEILLFRNNIDYDTKASYVFVGIDDEVYNKERNDILLEWAKEQASCNNLKLVVYNCSKIYNSLQRNGELNEMFTDDSLVKEQNKNTR